MYKDREKQKEANKLAAKRARAKRHTVIPAENVIPENHTLGVIPAIIHPIASSQKIAEVSKGAVTTYNSTDYRYWLTPPDVGDLVPQDYVKLFRTLPVSVQFGILRTVGERRRLELFDDTEERITRAVAYNEKPRVIPEKLVLATVK